MLSGIEHTREINVSHAQLAAWTDGMSIQKVMPEISAEDREFILNGITPEEWDALYNET